MRTLQALWHALSVRASRANGVICLLVLMSQAGLAVAQAEPPGRVGRMADFQGTVWVFEHEQGDWAAPLRNRPITSGDRISTGPDARAEMRVGSSVLRIGARSEIELLQLDDEHIAVQVHSGSVALRVRSRELASDFTLVTPEARFKPLRAGHYRIDRHDDASFASSLLGELVLEDAQAVTVTTGQRIEVWREGRERQLRQRWVALPQDVMSAWLAREDQQDQRTASTRFVSPEMTGAEELDRHGRWENHPDYGSLWVPIHVQAGWAPFRFGSWVWLRPWGWTWVDAQPWGFAPFHYGRWLMHRGRWCWAPGTYVARPAFAPALVSWGGGGQGGISAGVVIGTTRRSLPGTGWAPLAPREAYRPHHAASPGYLERVNPGHGGHDRHEPRDPRSPREPRDRTTPPQPPFSAPGHVPQTRSQPPPQVAPNVPAHLPPHIPQPVSPHAPQHVPPHLPRPQTPQPPAFSSPPVAPMPQVAPMPASRPMPPAPGVLPRPHHPAPSASAPGGVAPGGPPPRPKHERPRREPEAGANPEREATRARTPEVRQPDGRQGPRERENFR